MVSLPMRPCSEGPRRARGLWCRPQGVLGVNCPTGVQVHSLVKPLSSCGFHLLPHKWSQSIFLGTEVFPSLAFLSRKCHFCKELSCFLSFGLWFSCSGKVQAALAFSVLVIRFCFIRSLKYRARGLWVLYILLFFFCDWSDHIFFSPFVTVIVPF